MMTLMTNWTPRPPVQASLTLLVGVLTWTGVQLTTPPVAAASSIEPLAEREAVTCAVPRLAPLTRGGAPACAPLSGEAFHQASRWAKRAQSADQAILASPTCSVDELHALRRSGYTRQDNVMYGVKVNVWSRVAINAAGSAPAFELLPSALQAAENIMCRRGARRGNEKGPNPWLEDALTVRLGPQTAPASALPGQGAAVEPLTTLRGASSMDIPMQTIAHAPLNPSYTAMTPLPLQGLAMYYNPGVMRAVVEYRKNMGEIQTCDECIGFAALLRAGDLNRKIWIQWADGTIEGPFLVADVAARHHVDMLIQRGWAIDVDNQTAVRRGMFQPVAVTVHAAPPVAVD